MKNTFCVLWHSHQQPQMVGQRWWVQVIKLVKYYPFQAQVWLGRRTRSQRNKGPGFPGLNSHLGLTSLLPLPSPPEPLTQHRESGERPRFDRLTVRVGGGRILSEAGDKDFGTGTLLSPLLQVSGMKSRLGGDNAKLKKAWLLGSTPHLQSFTLLISIFFQLPVQSPVMDGLKNGDLYCPYVFTLGGPFHSLQQPHAFQCPKQIEIHIYRHTYTNT